MYCDDFVQVIIIYLHVFCCRRLSAVTIAGALSYRLDQTLELRRYASLSVPAATPLNIVTTNRSKRFSSLFFILQSDIIVSWYCMYMTFRTLWNYTRLYETMNEQEVYKQKREFSEFTYISNF